MTTRRSANEDGTGGYFYGYYASFDATDCGPVDEVLDAVARACRTYHHTQYWCDPMDYEDGGPSYVDNIEAKSKEAAAAFASLTARVEELEKCFKAVDDELSRGLGRVREAGAPGILLNAVFEVQGIVQRALMRDFAPAAEGGSDD